MPLSPLLFVLAVEILATKIRGTNVKGIQIDTSPLITIIKILQFADDTTLFLKDKEDLDVVITVFNQFANISGLRMSKQKTEAMWQGRDKSSRAEHQNINQGKSKYSAFISEVTLAHTTLRTTGLIKLKE